jgi:hypothetical protein
MFNLYVCSLVNGCGPNGATPYNGFKRMVVVGGIDETAEEGTREPGTDWSVFVPGGGIGLMNDCSSKLFDMSVKINTNMLHKHLHTRLLAAVTELR